MNQTIEQQYAIKFCAKLDKSYTDTIQWIQKAYGDSALPSSEITKWLRLFKGGWDEMTDNSDNLRSEQPSSSHTDENVSRVRYLLKYDHRMCVRMIARTLNLEVASVQTIITNSLNMRKVCAKLVPNVMTDEQKAHRVSIANELSERLKIEPDFLDKVVTGDETWAFEYNPETKSKVKTMLVVFFDAKGVVHYEFLPPGQDFNAVYYVDVLERLSKKIVRVREEIAATWVLHHGSNAPGHTALRVREFLAKHSLATLPQPPNSPDLAPADFFLFPRVKTALKGQSFDAIEAIQDAVTITLNEVPIKDFKDAYSVWVNRWKKCSDVRGEYLEDF